MHSKDLLDQRIIEHGSFTPYYETARLENAISEIVQIMSYSIQHRGLEIKLDLTDLNVGPLYKFDTRRLQ